VRWAYAQFGASPSVACIEWLDPLMAAGNWVLKLAEFGGGQNVFDETGRHSWLDRGAVYEREIPKSLFSGLAASTSREHALKQRRRVADPAGTPCVVKGGRFHLTDDNRHFNRRPVPALEHFNK